MVRLKRPRGRIDDSGEAWAKIVGGRASYHISFDEPGEKPRADDEAEVEVIATIDAITPSQRKHLGQNIVIALLTAEKYGETDDRAVHFFGSVNLRGSQRSALAYLPSRPFWALSGLIDQPDVWICIGWSYMNGGHGPLRTVFIGDAAHRERLLELGGNSLTTND
jgi:hypothetical protein